MPLACRPACAVPHDHCSKMSLQTKKTYTCAGFTLAAARGLRNKPSQYDLVNDPSHGPNSTKAPSPVKISAANQRHNACSSIVVAPTYFWPSAS